MSKESGLGWTTLTVDNDASAAKDIKNDVTDFDFAMPYAMQDITGVNMYARERLALLADFTGTLKGVFNPAADRAHAVLGGDLRVPRSLLLVVSSQTLTNEVLFSDYSLARGAGGEFTYSSPFALQDGTTPNWT